MKFLLLFVLHRGPGVARRSGEVHFDRRRRDTPVILPRPLRADDAHVSRDLLLQVALSDAELAHDGLELVAPAAESVAILRHVLQVVPARGGKIRELLRGLRFEILTNAPQQHDLVVSTRADPETAAGALAR